MKLYKEASLMMLPTSVKDGKLYSIFPQPKVIGEELVTYSDFNYGSGGWSLVDGKWTFDDTGSGYLNYTTISVTVGQIYKVVVDVSVPSGVANFRFTSGNGQTVLFDYTDFPDGVTTFYTTVSGVNGGIQRFYAPTSLSDAFTLNSISIREVDQLPADFDFSRGSNLAATRINEQGLIEKGRENLLLQSNNFDTSPWGGSSTIFTSGQSGYDGSNDAWLLTHPLSTNSTFQLNTNSGVQTFSIYAKSDGSTGIRLYAFGNENANAYFDLNNGAVRTASNVINSDIVSVGNGWYRCSITFNQTNTAFRIYTTNNATLQAAGSVYIQDAQLEVGLVAADYIESGATTGKAGVLEDLPRLDWSGSCPTLLLEPQRSNLIVNSEYIDNASTSYTPVDANTTLNAETSPEGLTNAVTMETTSTFPQIRVFSTSLSSGNHTFSVFAKYESSQYIVLRSRLFTNGTNSVVYFDVQNGSKGTSTGDTPIDYSIEDYGNGWYRCSLTFNVDAGDTTGSLYLYNSNTDGSIVSTVGETSIIYGFQLEQGSYATSYIPTHGTSVTRSRDEITDTSIDSFTDSSIGSVYFEIEDKGTASAASANFRFGSSSITNQWAFYFDTQGIKVYNYNKGAFLISNGTTVGETYKFVIRFNGNESTGFRNGTKYTTLIDDESFDITQLSRWYVDNPSIAIKEITFFPTALSDNECINLTTI